MGFLIVRPFKHKKGEFNVLVNCGWIPEDLQGENWPVTAALKTGKIAGLVKRDENLEIKRTNVMYPRTAEFFNLIDLEQLSEHWGLEISAKKGGFIELISETDKEGDLYPVIPSSSNFQKPYLTPRRHADYATFWGATASIGLLSMIKVLLF